MVGNVANVASISPIFKGRYQCIGKNLAMRELACVLALVVRDFTITFAPGEDGKSVDADMKDHFSAAVGKLDLVFRERRE